MIRDSNKFNNNNNNNNNKYKKTMITMKIMKIKFGILSEMMKKYKNNKVYQEDNKMYSKKQSQFTKLKMVKNKMMMKLKMKTKKFKKKKKIKITHNLHQDLAPDLKVETKEKNNNSNHAVQNAGKMIKVEGHAFVQFQQNKEELKQVKKVVNPVDATGVLEKTSRCEDKLNQNINQSNILIKIILVKKKVILK